MAWHRYYINCEKLYDPDENQQELCIFYNLHIPPHGGIRQEWTTIGMKHGTARISFVDYLKEDDDPDGVWEAFGMKAETVHTFTVNAGQADPEKLFMYTLFKDGSLVTGFDIDTENARAILVFPQPQTITASALLAVADKAEAAPRVQGAVEEIVINELLSGSKDILCLALFNR